MKRNICRITAIVCLALVFLPLAALAEATPSDTALVNLTPLINAALLVIAAIITKKLVPYLKERLTDSQFRNMISLLNVAVYAAEEFFPEGHGDEKLAMVQEYMKKKGFNVDIEAIKATVNQMRDEKNKGITFDDGLAVETMEIAEATEDEEPQT